jgi:hypothetical protein
VLTWFITMMLDIKTTNSYINLGYYYFISGCVLFLLSISLLYLLNLDLVIKHVLHVDQLFFLN